MIYKVPVWDVTLPSFVSGQAAVYGSASDVAAFMDRRREVEGRSYAGEESVREDELLRAYVEWSPQDMSSVPQVNVAYAQVPFVTECESLADMRRIDVSGHDETYENTWGFPYGVHVEGGEACVLLIRDGDRLVIVARYDVSGMTIDSDIGGRRLVSSSWGEPGVVRIEDEGRLSTTMFLPVSAYGDAEEARAVFDAIDDVSMAPLMGQIVADG